MSFCDDSAFAPPPAPRRPASPVPPPRPARDVLAVKSDIARLAERCIGKECTTEQAARAFIDRVDALVPAGLPEEQTIRLVIDAVATVPSAQGHFASAIEAWLQDTPYSAPGFDSIVIK